MPVFKGFQFEYPHYTVITPHAGLSFDVRSLNVMETDKLKGSLTVPAKAPAHINKILWKALVSKPDEIKTFEEFKKSTTIRDREALMYALYYSTFGDEREFNATCSNCRKSQLLKLKISDLFSMTAYPVSVGMKNTYKIAKAIDEDVHDPEIEATLNKSSSKRPPKEMPKELADLEFADEDDDGIILGEKPNYVKEEKPEPPKKEVDPVVPESENEDSILTKRIDLELPISKVHAIIKQPTLWDEERVMDAVPFAQKKQTDLLNETMVIEQFEQYKKGAKVPSLIIKNREDILYGYQSLPPLDKIEIFKKFQDTFGQYGIDLKTKYACSECGEPQELEVDIIVQFFRLLATV